jgi:crossover junction endodeoxyribonuclease RuvC
MTRIDIGIDPGRTGALAAIDHHTGDLIDIADMPVIGKHVSAAGVAAWLADMAHHGTLVVVLEDVTSSPQMGVVSAFSFGRSKGVVEGCVLAAGWPLHHVTPAQWKRQVGLRADKDAARQLATNTWPTYAQWFARKKDDGRAEAALLAGWCRANVGTVAA